MLISEFWRRFTVFSQVGGGDLHAVNLDLDCITAGKYTNNHGEIVVPAPVPGLFPAFVAKHIATHYQAGWTSGTVILIDKLDRLEWSTTQGLRDNLRRKFGVTYHKLRGEAALFVDGEYVEPIDPLFLTPDFYLHELDEDRAQAFDPVRIEVRDPDTASYMGAIVIRYAWLPPSFGSIDKARDAVGLNANARFSILKDYHGVIFSRNGRLIDVQNRTPWTNFINNDRYIKIEIEFSATLDEAFGVTTSKQQVTVSPLIWDLLRQAGLPKAIEQLRNKVKQAKVARRLEVLTPRNGERRLSERAMSIASAMGDGRSNNPQWDLALRVSPYRVEFEAMPDRAFFRVGRHGGARILYLNTTHRFYEELYDGPASTPELRSSLEVLLFSLGDVMLEGSEETQARNQTQLMSWSRRLDLALGMLAAHLKTGDDQDIGQLALAT